MSDHSDAAPRTRFVGHPNIDLREAVENVVRAGRHGVAHAEDAFADYMGHKTSNSGAFRAKMAALRDWGLIESRSGGQVVLTSLAKDLVLSDDALREQVLLEQAFRTSHLMEAVYEQLGRGTALPLERVARQAVLRHHVNPAQQQRFAEVFVSSAVTSGLAQRDGASVVLSARGAAPPDLPAEAAAETAEGPVPVERAATEHLPPTRDSAEAILMQQHWAAGQWRVVLQVVGEGALPASVFGELGGAMERLEGLAAALEAATPSTTA